MSESQFEKMQRINQKHLQARLFNDVLKFFYDCRLDKYTPEMLGYSTRLNVYYELKAIGHSVTLQKTSRLLDKHYKLGNLSKHSDSQYTKEVDLDNYWSKKASYVSSKKPYARIAYQITEQGWNAVHFEFQKHLKPFQKSV